MDIGRTDRREGWNSDVDFTTIWQLRMMGTRPIFFWEAVLFRSLYSWFYTFQTTFIKEICKITFFSFDHLSKSVPTASTNFFWNIQGRWKRGPESLFRNTLFLMFNLNKWKLFSVFTWLTLFVTFKAVFQLESSLRQIPFSSNKWLDVLCRDVDRR